MFGDKDTIFDGTYAEFRRNLHTLIIAQLIVSLYTLFRA